MPETKMEILFNNSDVFQNVELFQLPGMIYGTNRLFAATIRKTRETLHYHFNITDKNKNI